jgi:hypothetical protein
MENTPSTKKTTDLAHNDIVDLGYCKQAVRLVEESDTYGADGTRLWVVETYDSSYYHGSSRMVGPDKEWTVWGKSTTKGKRTPTQLEKSLRFLG